MRASSFTLLKRRLGSLMRPESSPRVQVAATNTVGRRRCFSSFTLLRELTGGNGMAGLECHQVTSVSIPYPFST